MKATKRTGYAYHELFAYHHPGQALVGDYPASTLLFDDGETKRRMHSLVAASDLLQQLHQLPVTEAPEEDILRVHSAELLEALRRADEFGERDEKYFDYAYVGRGSLKIAKLAAGAVLNAIDAVLDDKVDNAYCLVRPPGHHAEANRSRGFCLLNNVAIGAAKAATVRNQRVAIVDIDVHHGNGSEAIFANFEPAVLTISLHQERLYPVDSGDIGAGGPNNLNVPLPPGCGYGAYDYAMQQIVLPALAKFKPDLLLVSCGFDAAATDPLGRMQLSSSHFGLLAGALASAAPRSVFCQEGGYSPQQLPFCGARVLEALAALPPAGALADPFDAEFAGYATQRLEPHQRDAVERARTAYAERALL